MANASEHIHDVISPVIEGLLHPAAILDAHGRIVGCNDGFADCVGPLRALTGHVLHDRENQLIERQLSELRTGRKLPISLALIQDGAPFMLSMVALPGMSSLVLCQQAARQGTPDSEARLRFDMEDIEHAAWSYDARTDRFAVSNTWRRMRGLAPDEGPNKVNGTWLEDVHPDDRQALKDLFEAQTRGERESINIQYRHRHTDGHWVWILCQARVMEVGTDGLPIRILGTDTDVSSVKQAEGEMLSTSNKLQMAIEASGMGVWEFDPSTSRVHWDDRLLEMYGFPEGENDRSGDLWETYIHPDDKKETRAYSDHCKRHNADFNRDFRIIRQDGAVRHIRSLARFVSAPKVPGKFIGVNIDVTEDVERAEALELARQQLEYDSRHDALTGLANRRKLDEATQKLFDTIQDVDQYAAMNLDLDYFKQINDTLGHALGDAVLVHTAARLLQIVEEQGLVARVGGDEFVILLPQAPPRAQIETLCEKIIARCQEPVTHDGHTCVVGVSIGVAVAQGKPNKPSQIFIDADSALYAAKEDGRSRFRLYSAEIKSRSDNDAYARQELLDALANGEIICHYQPQYDANTLQVVGAEALVRWNSPMRGIIMPEEFMPLVTKSGLSGRFDQHVFQHVIDQQSHWAANGVAFPKIALNVSMDRLLDKGLVDEVTCLLQPHHDISFELLETAFLDTPNAMASCHLTAIRALGISLELDDFGSGHSSIVALQAIKPDRVKIDQRLVDPINVDPNQLLLLQSLSKIARLNGSEVVVEGLETGIHLAAIRNVDCDALQGYALTHPMPADAFEALLAEGGQQAAK